MKLSILTYLVYQFRRCIPLWMHALRLKQLTKTSIRKDLLKFAIIFSQMLNRVGISFDTIRELIEIAATELNSSREEIITSPDIHSKIAAQEDLDGNMLEVLYLFVIAAKVSEPNIYV